MAGRKQHFIPQMVQRAFEARHTGLKSQVYVYQKGGSYLTSTDGVGAERDFYSNPDRDGVGSLDDRITDFESDELNSILTQLRAVTGGPVDTESAAIAIAHLTVRTAHLRGTMTSLIDGAVTRMQSILEDVESVRDFAGIDTAESDSRMSEMIREELSGPGFDVLSDSDRYTIERIAAFLVRERFAVLFAQNQGQLQEGLAALGARMPETVAKGHAAALSGTLLPKERVRALCELNWRIVSTNEADLRFILPDCVAIASGGPSKEFEPFAMIASDEISIVVMPISSSQLLIGGDQEIKLDDINLRFARCCFKFFISSRQAEEISALAQFIGAFSEALNLDLLEGGMEPNKRPPTKETLNGRVLIRTPAGKFGVAVRQAIATIVNESVDLPVLDAIESIIVPSKLETALEAYLKRPPSKDELTVATLNFAEPIKCGTRWKCRVIVSCQMAEMLLQSDRPEMQAISRRLVRISLGRAYYIGCWSRLFPAVFEHQEPSLWMQTSLQLAFRAASQYFGASAARGGEAEPVVDDDGYRLIAANIATGLRSLGEVRRHFFEHRNVDQLTIEASASLDVIMGAVAALSGFAVAQEAALAKDSLPANVLQNAGLWDWAVLFAKDLAKHFERRYRWSSEQELLQLASHVERLMWTIGVTVTPLGQQCMIHVADANGLAKISRVLRE